MYSITEGGLIVDKERNECCGYLMNFQGHGVYSPDGKQPFTKEQADAHNKALSQGELIGLDKAEVGQCGTFYWSPEKGVTTWTGELVARGFEIRGKTTLTFRRPNGHVFRGRIQKDADCFNFKRIA